MGGDEARRAEIEAKLMLAEDLLESLNRAVYRQQQQIDRLEAEVRALRLQVEATAAASEQRRPADEVPPHY